MLGVHFEKDLSRFSDYNMDCLKGKNACELKMGSGSIPLAEVIGRCVRGGSDDENSDESEDDISDMSEESEEDLDCEEQEAGETSQSNLEASEGKCMFVFL